MFLFSVVSENNRVVKIIHSKMVIFLINLNKPTNQMRFSYLQLCFGDKTLPESKIIYGLCSCLFPPLAPQGAFLYDFLSVPPLLRRVHLLADRLDLILVFVPEKLFCQ